VDDVAERVVPGEDELVDERAGVARGDVLDRVAGPLLEVGEQPVTEVEGVVGDDPQDVVLLPPGVGGGAAGTQREGAGEHDGDAAAGGHGGPPQSSRRGPGTAARGEIVPTSFAGANRSRFEGLRPPAALSAPWGAPLSFVVHATHARRDRTDRRPPAAPFLRAADVDARFGASQPHRTE